ncbi:MAG TPA: anthranilate phosphoribosyltransferase [bacterium]|nr:anthranilate phosphoribosyltransferase [bacterium]
MIKEALKRWLERQDVSEDEACAVMGEIMRGEATPAQVGGVLVALRMKNETAAELAGMVCGMRTAMVTVNAGTPDAIDSCGTGGDGTHTFNISTAAALVAAGAGATVAKHGNRSVSSLCGSADVFEALGVNINPGREAVERLLREVKIAFLFAPAFHPAMKHAVGPRRELGVRTVFNLLGPLCNPAQVRRQLVGVYSRAAQDLMAGALARLDTRHALLVNSGDGLDEISLAGPTRALEVKQGAVSELLIDPAAHGLARAELASLRGGDAAVNAQIITEILAGSGTAAQRDIVLLNAAAALLVADRAATIADGLTLARQSIASGAARGVLGQLRALAPAPAQA